MKTTKVGCYLHGDGIANVIHSDGLANFSSKDYRGKLRNDEGSSDNPRFDFVLSNPPYSVSAFKGNIKNENAKNDFTLYERLTDSSSEIECFAFDILLFKIKRPCQTKICIYSIFNIDIIS